MDVPEVIEVTQEYAYTEVHFYGVRSPWWLLLQEMRTCSDCRVVDGCNCI